MERLYQLMIKAIENFVERMDWDHIEIKRENEIVAIIIAPKEHSRWIEHQVMAEIEKSEE